jgi:hypothetical protein
MIFNNQGPNDEPDLRLFWGTWSRPAWGGSRPSPLKKSIRVCPISELFQKCLFTWKRWFLTTKGLTTNRTSDFFDVVSHGLPEAGRVNHLWKSLYKFVPFLNCFKSVYKLNNQWSNDEPDCRLFWRTWSRPAWDGPCPSSLKQSMTSSRPLRKVQVR